MTQDETKAADILMGDVVRLEDVLSRDDVTTVSKSFFNLFQLPVRVISQEGDLLADVHVDRPLCNRLNTLPEGAARCAATVSVVRDLEPRVESLVHPCFTGAVYRVVPLSYQGRPLGRFIVGPYVPAEIDEAPASLLSVEGAADPRMLNEQFRAFPRVREDVAEQLCDHLKRVLELLVFSGHRAQLASTMQVESVRENYRELATKNEELEESFAELKHLDELKSKFLATVSHELRTPLTSIIGYTEMLESGSAGPLSSGQSEFLGTIRSKADELLGLISALLDLGRLEAKDLELQHEQVDPRALLSAVGSTIVPAANRRNVTLDIRVENESPKIWGDPVRMDTAGPLDSDRSHAARPFAPTIVGLLRWPRPIATANRSPRRGLRTAKAPARRRALRRAGLPKDTRLSAVRSETEPRFGWSPSSHLAR